MDKKILGTGKISSNLDTFIYIVTKLWYIFSIVLTIENASLFYCGIVTIEAIGMVLELYSWAGDLT